MTKHRYRTIECKKFEWRKLAETVSGRRVVLSIDVAKVDFVAAFVLEERVVARVKWKHPAETLDWLAGVEAIAKSGKLEAVMEPSGTYGDALRWQLTKRDIEVYLVSPKRVHDAAEVYDGVPSMHDAKAAEIIGHLHLAKRSVPWPVLTAERRMTNAMLSRLLICKKRHQAELNRLEAQLSRHWPESLDILGQTSLTLQRVLVAFGGPEQVYAHAEEVKELMRRKGGPGMHSEKIDRLLCSAGQTLGVPCITEESEGLQWLAERSLETHDQVRTIEHEIEQQVNDNEVLTNTAKTVGKVTSAVLLAALGDPRDYLNADSYCKGMGLNLKERSSGKHKGQLRITKRGPSVARYYLYFATLRLIAKEPLVKRWFKTKTSRPGAIKLKTVIELMRKLVKGLWHSAQGEEFRIDKLFNLKAVENN
jgi:transposase